MNGSRLLIFILLIFSISSCLNRKSTTIDSDYVQIEAGSTAAIITSITPPLDGAYGEGSSLDFQIFYSGIVTVTGTPCLSLTIGNSIKQACYTTGSSSKILNFSYTIQAGENDSNGISLGDEIELRNGGIKDFLNEDTNLKLNSVFPSLIGVTVNTAITPPDSVSSVSQTNLSSDRKEVTFTWSAPNDNGAPITEYIVRYKLSTDLSYTYLNPNPTSTSTTITDLLTETSYDIQVAAYNGVIGPYSSVLNISTVFNPASLGSLVWFEAKDINGDGSTVVDGTSVSTMMDKSGNANNAVKVSGTDATIETEGGYKVLRMGAAGYRTATSLGEVANTDVEVYIVAKTRVVSSSFAFVNENKGNNRYGTHFPWSDSNAYVDLPIGNRFSGNWGGNTTDFFAWTFRSSTTQGRVLERDGTQLLSAGNKSNTAALKRWTIGSNYIGSGAFWQADLQAFFVFDKILDAQQRQDFFQYIEDEYGVVMP